MKTLAVIGASYLQKPLVLKAREMGLRVICFAWEEGAVCKDLADRFYPVSITEKEQILEICREEEIDGICTIASDTAAPTVAYVAEKMGLTGNSYVSAACANDKYRMRNAFSAAGIRCPHYSRVMQNEPYDFTGWSFPLIVKPCDRSGSLGVNRVDSIKELQKGIIEAQGFSFKHEAIVEEYIEGREISVEFISFNGVHYPLTITDKVTTGAPHFVELEHHQPAELSEDQFAVIYRTTSMALDALGITQGASHTEYRITDDGDIVILELGARMGGDFIGSDLVRLSTGYDFVKGVIEVALGTFNEPVFNQASHSGVFFLCKETDRLLPVFDNHSCYSSIVAAERQNPILKAVKCSADRSGFIIYQSEKRLVL